MCMYVYKILLGKRWMYDLEMYRIREAYRIHFWMSITFDDTGVKVM